MKESILEITKKSNLISISATCPQCGDNYVYGVPYVTIPCKKCGITYKTDFKQSLYTKISGRLNTLLAWNDKVTINVDNDYYQDLSLVEKNFNMMKCWDVSEMGTYHDEYKYCKVCGICLNCIQCKDCGHHFEPDKNRRKQRCPECQSNNIKRSYFSKVETNAGSNVCPHCHSDNIKMTKTNKKTTCSKCKSKKLSESVVRTMYSLIITRKKGYFRDN